MSAASRANGEGAVDAKEKSSGVDWFDDSGLR
jgi:hypothetical protein